ncbi:MAG: sigma-70 family RNA polymerase sigma factor [Candidatus Obscuribacterales bacterium]|nr:sigma-70 family RNA polymerase sigma factor [Candidatus Obscuribacterales bacterium]
MKSSTPNLASIKGMRSNIRVIKGGKKDYLAMSDTDLIIACQQKDQEAFKYLFKRYESTVIGMIYRLAPDWKDTSDLVQETMIRIWRSIDQLRNPCSFKTWLNQIVTNLFYDELRKRPRQFQIVSLDEPVQTQDGSDNCTRDIPDKAPQPEGKLLVSELSSALADAMSHIPDQFRKVAVLRDVEGLSYEEIAEITGTRLGTVKSRIARARLKIQEHITPYLDCA